MLVIGIGRPRIEFCGNQNVGFTWMKYVISEKKDIIDVKYSVI